MTKTAIEITDLNFSFENLAILENINMSIEQGDFAGLVGPNGGGKTTLLKLILGLYKPQSGKIAIFGEPLKNQRKTIGYVPQYANFNSDFPISVQDTVLQGRLGISTCFGRYCREDKIIAQKVMQETEILNLAHRSIQTLSGGQMQRVLVARALAAEPEIMLLDEPTANIDQRAEKDIFDIFKAINERMTILIISHDIGFVSDYINKVFCLNKTLVCHDSTPVTSDTIHTLYGGHVNEIHHHH
ncbi:MAG: metal ABC transporter ATP-binding protein [gamma proteobacterium symbiont of Bathyaustriella thionipta]|nr:metal ABC transporter ATP-binding protein [gamma proteobacterium symbiont of Bathyaustriella thionipta]MCU7950144.1 metal ABC transporter ATP-binding protein [gamma proteobacterium symbiont of Bathyaustriella thionipta]MCU7952270.1 metal ABC transporter ATP-binding protein [gamma proteobacterium symbiont of Bathyaustriella thionipta]MCU7956944.1 metal ABC transporter ATP-binding protein [gamma proteobacterium symbiont of Bathyaustriella thionipta]MCU7965803.1 metal ABC transporter ATP-bindin